MRRVTLKDARLSILSTVSGLCTNDLARDAAVVNLCQERLLTDPMAPDEGWWGGSGRMQFNVQVSRHGAYISTPQNVARVIAFAVCNEPIRLRNGFYEFLEFGIGLQPRLCKSGTQCVVGPWQLTQAYERDNVYTLTDFPSTPQRIAVYPTSAADVGKRVLVQGPDQNNKTVYSDLPSGTPVLGEYVTLEMPFALSVNEFSSLTGIQKDVTMGPVSIYTSDPTTFDQTLLSSMEPGETSAQYRRYFLNGLPCRCCNTPSGQVQVVAQVRFDYQPVVNDPDYLTIQSIPALIEEARALRFSDMDDPRAMQMANNYHAKALSLLNGQLDHFFGKTQTAVGVSLFGNDRVIVQPT